MIRSNMFFSAPRRLTMRGLFVFALLFLFVFAATGAQAADGDLDLTFSGDGVNYVEWSGGDADDASLGIGADGKIYVGATITDANGDRDFAITRLRTDGNLDTTFGFQGYRSISFDYVADGYDNLRGVFPLSDGKLMLLGNAEISGEIIAAAPPAMARLTATGNLDTSFGTAGRLSIDPSQSPWPTSRLYLRAIARQRDGKFLFGGHCTSCVSSYSALVLRVDENGVPDATFGQNGWARVGVPQPSGAWSIDIDRQGRIVLAATTVNSGAYLPLIARFTASGTPDAILGFGPGYVTPPLPESATVGWGATAIAIDRDDKVLVSLQNRLALAVARTAIFRLGVEGGVDSGYGVGGLRDLTRDDGSRILALALRSDRRLVSAGWIDHSGLDFFVARTLSNGALDNSFDGNGVARYALTTSRDEAQAMVLSAGKPIIAGRTQVGDNGGISIMRLQSDLIFADGIE